MKSPDGACESSWYVGVTVPRFNAARASRHDDVCIVGAGIAGLTTAYLLLKEGLSVSVLDEGPIGRGQTGRTSAHLASAIDDRFMHIEKKHGEETSRLAYQSHAAAIDTIEKISRDEKIDCQFERVDAFLSPGDKSNEELDQEFAAAKRAGFADIERLERGGMDNGPCIRFGNQARFQPMQYLAGLAEKIKEMGGRIYTGKRVSEVQGSDPKAKKPGEATIVGGVKITANHIVVATNTPSPINDWFGIYTKQHAYRTYVVAAKIPRGAISDALYWDMADPYHYVRTQHLEQGDHDLLLIGGEDHKTGQFPAGAAPFLRLETWGRHKFPKVGEVEYRWSGQVQEPVDGLAFIGRALTKNQEVFVITGDSGMGLTHGTLGAMLVKDLIQKRQNPWEKIYHPSRKIMNTEFVTENANTVAQYKDLITPGDVKSVEEIHKGHGAVMREGLSKIAIYRDDQGKLHRHSAVCTHLQCIVQWNDVEKSWDCPCHGSRFDATGKVLMGPAIDDLPGA